jgi:uncharacterized protein (TIGR03437 family)
MFQTLIALTLLCSSAYGAEFIEKANYPVNLPFQVQVADLNGDGKLDLIVLTVDSVVIFLGNGDGTFVQGSVYMVEANYVVVGDVNGDKIPDLVLATHASLQAYLGNGDGTFRAGGSFGGPNVQVSAPALGDFNHDGKLDVAQAVYASNQLQVLLGNGDGTFQPPMLYPTRDNPDFALAVDLNHDGNLDLVVGIQGTLPAEEGTSTSPTAPGIEIMLGRGDGTFGQPSFIKQPDFQLGSSYWTAYLQALDFDGDGNIDLLVQANFDPLTAIFYGDGTGNFETTTVMTDAVANECVGADFDGDGKPDIACTGYFLTLVTNLGNRTFSSSTYIPGEFAWVAAGDFNQDGKQDVVTVGGIPPAPSGVYVYLNGQAPTSLSINVDQRTLVYGQTSYFTATVNTALQGYNSGCFSACPQGTVTWFDGTQAIATSALTPTTNHAATSMLDANLAGGSHVISASYSGTELPSTSGTINLQVLPATAAMTISASPANPVYGAGVTIAVAISPPSAMLAAPTGAVAIQENGATLATLSLNAAGQAASAPLMLTGGTHTVQAKYSGDANYASTSATVTVMVAPGPIQLALTCTPNPAASNELVSCVGRLANQNATGSVTLEDGSKMLGSANVVAGQAQFALGTLAGGTHSFQASYSGDSNYAAAQAPAFSLVVTAATEVASVAAADGHPTLAPQTIGAAYGSGFAPAVTVAGAGALPTTLAGVRLTITDSTGAQQPAPLYFVSPNQINFLTPGLASGAGRVDITAASGALFTGPITIQPVSPALFSANADGQGVAAAYLVHVGPDGTQTMQYAFTCASTAGSCVAAPLNLGAASDQNVLVLFGSGIRNAAKVAVSLGTTAGEVAFFGAQGQFVGLDQVNVQVPFLLAGQGQVEIALTADGETGNKVVVEFH